MSELLSVSKTTKAYESLSNAWDKAADALEGDALRPIRYGKCFRYLRSLDRTSKLLEVGCGEGTGLRIAQSLGFCNLTGTDVSGERLRRAKSRMEGVDLILTSPDNVLPFESGSFDAVVSAAVIEHSVNPEAFVLEIARVVRPGGEVVISSDCWQWRMLQFLGLYQSVQPLDRALSPSRLFRMFRKSGLRLICYEGFPLPGQEFRFWVTIGNAVLGKRIMESLGWVIRQVKRAFRLPGCLVGKLRQRHPKTTEEPTIVPVTASEPEIFSRVVGEEWKSSPKMTSYLKLMLSNENVFYLLKEEK